jgi:cellobiose phosphorylase
MYRLIVESLLGLEREGQTMRFSPCLPDDWQAFKVRYRYRDTVYHMAIFRRHTGDGEASVTLDGVRQHSLTIPLVDDHRDHSVEAKLDFGA